MEVVVHQSLVCRMETEEEMAAVFKRFGDEQSTLLDKYERLSFEVQLNQAILLGRSLSSPAVGGRRVQKQEGCRRPPPPPSRRSRGLGFQKAVKKLLSPIIGRKLGARKGGDDEEARAAAAGGPNAAAKDPIMFWKAFSKSLRV